MVTSFYVIISIFSGKRELSQLNLASSVNRQILSELQISLIIKLLHLRI